MCGENLSLYYYGHTAQAQAECQGHTGGNTPLAHQPATAPLGKQQRTPTVTTNAAGGSMVGGSVVRGRVPVAKNVCETNSTAWISSTAAHPMRATHS